MSYKVNITWMVHEGGTKYYQVFQINRIDKRHANAANKPGIERYLTITHWGARDGSTPNFHRPVNGGQTQIKAGSGYSAAITKKAKRGYAVTGKETTFTHSNAILFKDWVVSAFGAAKAHEIFLELCLVGPDEGKGFPDDDPSDTGPTIQREYSEVDELNDCVATLTNQSAGNW